MKTVIIVMSLLLASTAQAAMNQAQCPPDTLWDSSTNQCYPDPNSESAIREQERQRREAERAKEEQRYNQQMDNAARDAERKRRIGSETIITNPSQPLFIDR